VKKATLRESSKAANCYAKLKSHLFGDNFVFAPQFLIIMRSINVSDISCAILYVYMCEIIEFLNRNVLGFKRIPIPYKNLKSRWDNF
jgi:hypothetical protein